MEGVKYFEELAEEWKTQNPNPDAMDILIMPEILAAQARGYLFCLFCKRDIGEYQYRLQKLIIDQKVKQIKTLRNE